MSTKAAEWKKMIQAASSDCTFTPGCSLADVRAAERKLGRLLPEPLKSLLLETNGLYDQASQLQTIWTLEDIVAKNLESFTPLSKLVFFGNAGADGILFAISGAEIVAWYPIEHEYPAIASSLQQFLAGWFGGSLHV